MRNPILLSSMVALLGCDVTLEEPGARGGLAPEPRATLEGTLTYSGPPPLCDEDGRILGRALLTLFFEAAPPPPEGSGLPASLLLIPGDRLFRADVDCRQPDDARTLVRSVGFEWPAVPLDGPTGNAAIYRLLATWDMDVNLNPLYIARSSPTLQDVLGGAFEGSIDNPVQARLQVGPSSARPNGQVLSGISVNLVLPVSTELPVSRLAEGTAPLDSAVTLPLAFDRAQLEAGLAATTGFGLELPDITEPRYARALEAAGLELSADPLARAFYLRGLDLDADGDVDGHPVLGPVAGVPRLTPVVVFARARTPAEVQAGIPDVILLPHPVSDRGVKASRVDLVTPPVAVVQLDPVNPACQIPYAAPGNATLVYELAGAVCSELPTGAYNVNVVHGVAGGMPTATSTAVSETGFDLVGGQSSGQFWVIPNELGPPDTRYNPAALNQLDPPDASATRTLTEQGPEGRFFVVDSDPTEDLPSARPACQEALDPLSGGVRPIQFTPVPAVCCARVAHLCGLPLCAAELRGAGQVRELTALDEDGKATCVPFEMPPSCCAG